jgi:hypothetical protein
MRQILVDRARRNKREKRGGGEPAAAVEEANTQTGAIPSGG